MNQTGTATPPPKSRCSSCVFFDRNAYTLVIDGQGRVLSVDAGAATSPRLRALVGVNLIQDFHECPCGSTEAAGALIAGARDVLEGGRDFYSHEYSCPILPHRRRFRVSAVRLNGGGPARAILTHTDVTVANQEREALRLTQFATDSAADAIFWVDERGQINYVNEAAIRLTGYPKERLLAMTVPDLDPAIAEKGWAAEWEDVRSHGAVRVHTTIQRQDGRLVPIELTATFVRCGDRELACAFLRDLTERKKLEEQFFQAQKLEAVARLAGGVAHDFNNLLTVINGYSNLLLDQATQADPLRELYQEINDAGRRAASLTRKLLAFSRKEIVVPGSLDLNLVLREFERMLRRLLGEDIRILMDLNPELGRIHADPGQIEQVVMNLCVNARDAMPKGGSVVLQTTNITLAPAEAARPGMLPPGFYVRLVVADTGCGMDAAVLSRLFEPFFTTKERGRGTGLGLSTVCGIVQGAGGHISVESVPGKGTSFTILFPRTEAPAMVAPENRKPAPAGRETVLLVEDERPVRFVVRRLLESRGYRVLEAHSEIEALRLASDPAIPIDLLLSDIVMPSLSGIELAERLRRVRPSLQVLLMSGYTDRGAGQGGIPAGMGFLQKPFTLEAVATKVREILDQQAPLEVLR